MGEFEDETPAARLLQVTQAVMADRQAAEPEDAAHAALFTEEQYAAVTEYYVERIESGTAHLHEVLRQAPGEFQSGSRLTTLRAEAANVKAYAERLLYRLDEIEEGR